MRSAWIEPSVCRTGMVSAEAGLGSKAARSAIRASGLRDRARRDLQVDLHRDVRTPVTPFRCQEREPWAAVCRASLWISQFSYEVASLASPRTSRAGLDAFIFTARPRYTLPHCKERKLLIEWRP